MTWLSLSLLLLALTAQASPSETQYLLFQLFPPPSPKDVEQNLAFPPGEEAEKAVASLLNAIGSKGDASNKLGITLGPLTLAQSSTEVRGLIRDGFRIAKEKSIAIAFHLDDQMFWGAETGLRGQAGSREWLDWNGTVNTGRRLD